MPTLEPEHLQVQFTVSRSESDFDLFQLRLMLDQAAREEGLSGELGVWLCTDSEIADLHQQFMDIPGPTDVITFPGDDPATGGYLGDIAVSIDTAAIQAEEAGHDVQREIAYLCLHGLLHLAGYDDLDPTSRSTMILRQEALLDEFERSYPEQQPRTTGCQPRYDDSE